MVLITFDGVHVCKSTERELPAVSDIIAPRDIVDEDGPGFDDEGATCSLSPGAVMEDTRSAASFGSPHLISRSGELYTRDGFQVL